jgi:nicotinamidase-related amidase
MNTDLSGLVTAFKQAQLCAMHIDLQDLFYFPGDDCPTDQAFHVTNDFAQELRQIDIPNFWVACLYETPEIIPYNHAHQKTADIFHKDINVLPNEIVVTKATSSAFGNRLLTPFLNHTGLTTQIATGVFFDSCYQKTIENALMQGFNVYACLDATDCPKDEHQDFKPRFFNELPQEAQDRLHVTNTQELLDTLQPVMQPSCFTQMQA